MRTSLILSLIAALGLVLPAQAQTRLDPLDGTELAVQTVAKGFDQPLHLAAPKGDKRLFIVEQTGRIRILLDGRVLPEPFLNLSAKISAGMERGLLGLAFHPGFAANGRFFVYYTDRSGALTVAEGQADPTANRANASVTPLLTIPHDKAPNHNGGWLGFGPDGLLYIGTGDGGDGGDPWGNAQNPAQRLGKILRIDVDAGAKPYAIPPGNPFAQGGGAPEVFALGLRNPWRAAFDGDLLYIADVGQNAFEEVTVLQTRRAAGANLGWNRVEGRACYGAKTCDPSGLTAPVHVYSQDQGCSVTGGFVYRGAALPALQGRYLFSDFCTGTLNSFRYQNGRAKDVTTGSVPLGQITSFGLDGLGEVYLLTFDGTVLKLIPG